MKTFNYKSFVLAMLVCMAGALCVSCGGDDGDDDGASGNDGGQSSYSKMIVGEWTVYYEDDGPRRVDISFTAAGIYSAEESYKQGDGTWSSSPFNYSGTYSVYGNTVNIVDKSGNGVFAGKLKIISMTDEKLTFRSEDGNITFRGEKIASVAQSLIVGSWKTISTSYVNGKPYTYFQIFTFNADGTGSDSGDDIGNVWNLRIRYVYDSRQKLLTITYLNDGAEYVYKVKSISSTKLVMSLGASGTGDEEVFYRM